MAGGLRPAVLYISYDGMLEPLGQSQVVSYLERLSGEFEVHLVSFEKPADREQADKVAAIAARIEKAGIKWHPLTYHKTPTIPATLFDIVQGTLLSVWLSLRHRISLIHARSYVPALIGWIVKLLTGARLLFDMRGFWADERADSGVWPAQGKVYRTAKRIENTLLLGSDHIVTLTHASNRELTSLPVFKEKSVPPISVIPTCADLDRFQPALSAGQPFIMGYVGSVGPRYLFDEVLRCFALLRQQHSEARLLVINQKEQDLVRQAAARVGIPSASIEVRSADHNQIHRQVQRMTAAAAFYRPVYSTIACAPTKLAEYLGCGIPCLGNTGVGDMADILEREGCGVAITEFTAQERSRAIDRLLDLTRDQTTALRCRETALRHFSVVDGAEQYRAIYRSLTQ